jgi:hypothetical protein
MELDSANVEKLVTEYSDFSVEGFNIFAVGKDRLPHLICVCPNRSFARAIQSLLSIAKYSQDLPMTNLDLTGICLLSPRMLADGTLALVATRIDDAVWRNGNEVEYDDLELQLGTSPYQSFVAQFLEEASSQNSQTVLHVYEDTLIRPQLLGDDFPF